MEKRCDDDIAHYDTFVGCLQLVNIAYSARSALVCNLLVRRDGLVKSQNASKGRSALLSSGLHSGLLWQLWQLAEAGEISLEFLMSLALFPNEASP